MKISTAILFLCLLGWGWYVQTGNVVIVSDQESTPVEEVAGNDELSPIEALASRPEYASPAQEPEPTAPSPVVPTVRPPATDAELALRIQEFRARARMNAGHAGSGTPTVATAPRGPKLKRSKPDKSKMSEAERIIDERETGRINPVASTRDTWNPQGDRRAARYPVMRYRGKYYCDISGKTHWLTRDKKAPLGYRQTGNPFR